MTTFVLDATTRSAEHEGKGASRRLRREAKIPAIIYGGDKEPLSVSLELRQVVKALESEAFFTSDVTVKVDGQDHTVRIQALQRHPAKNTPMHADFVRVG
ncbi:MULTISPECIES: 50S ribosomal protein L25 [unclassified Acinetobacter]|uniref:50S ribosomal protein L25 n=1 Tax=unclassified Acinetobacter TaxID=196816 RepID=UPI0035BA9FF3